MKYLSFPFSWKARGKSFIWICCFAKKTLNINHVLVQVGLVLKCNIYLECTFLNNALQIGYQIVMSLNKSCFVYTSICWVVPPQVAWLPQGNTDKKMESFNSKPSTGSPPRRLSNGQSGPGEHLVPSYQPSEQQFPWWKNLEIHLNRSGLPRIALSRWQILPWQILSGHCNP